MRVIETEKYQPINHKEPVFDGKTQLAEKYLKKRTSRGSRRDCAVKHVQYFHDRLHVSGRH
jgi:hypothetical protein